jgi:hypothetical protein
MSAYYNEICFAVPCGFSDFLRHATEWTQRRCPKALGPQCVTGGVGLLAFPLSVTRILEQSSLGDGNVRHRFGNMNKQQFALRSAHNALRIGERSIGFLTEVSCDKYFAKGGRWSYGGRHGKSPGVEDS